MNNSMSSKVLYMNNNSKTVQVKELSEFIKNNLTMNRGTNKLYIMNKKTLIDTISSNPFNNFKLNNLNSLNINNTSKFYVTEQVYNLLSISTNKFNTKAAGQISIFNVINKNTTGRNNPVVPNNPIVPSTNNINKELYNALVLIMKKQQNSNFNNKLMRIIGNESQAPNVTRNKLNNMIMKLSKKNNSII